MIYKFSVLLIVYLISSTWVCGQLSFGIDHFDNLNDTKDRPKDDYNLFFIGDALIETYPFKETTSGRKNSVRTITIFDFQQLSRKEKKRSLVCFIDTMSVVGDKITLTVLIGEYVNENNNIPAYFICYSVMETHQLDPVSGCWKFRDWRYL